jgi:DNA-binding transcriptional regulator PaaX
MTLEVGRMKRNGRDRSVSSNDPFACQDIIAAMGVVGGHSTLRLMAELLGLARGLSEMALRSRLANLVGRGLLKRSGRGPDAVFEVASWPARDDTVARKMAKHAAGWNGAWHVLTYDIRVEQNSLRRRLARFLHDAGFGLLCASSWASPYDWEDELREILASRDAVGHVSYIRSSAITSLAGEADPVTADLWNLRPIAAQYESAAGRCAAASKDRSPSARRRRAQTYFRAVRELQQIEAGDPMLPATLLKERWPRASAVSSLDQLQAGIRRDMREASGY